MCVTQVRSTSAIAFCLWILEIFLQLAKAMLDGGSIATMREQKKLNKDAVVLFGEYHACWIYILFALSKSLLGTR